MKPTGPKVPAGPGLPVAPGKPGAPLLPGLPGKPAKINCSFIYIYIYIYTNITNSGGTHPSVKILSEGVYMCFGKRCCTIYLITISNTIMGLYTLSIEFANISSSALCINLSVLNYLLHL